jgi:DNA-binding response OmpR family regulator
MVVSGRVMILEDDAALLDLLTIFLGDLGYTIFGASDSKTALDFIQAGGIELAVVDVGAHGLRIAREAASRNIPCIMISGRPVLFEIGGLGDILRKPFKPTDLQGKIEAALRNYRSTIYRTDKPSAAR